MKSFILFSICGNAPESTINFSCFDLKSTLTNFVVRLKYLSILVRVDLVVLSSSKVRFEKPSKSIA